MVLLHLLQVCRLLQTHSSKLNIYLFDSILPTIKRRIHNSLEFYCEDPTVNGNLGEIDDKSSYGWRANIA